MHRIVPDCYISSRSDPGSGSIAVSSSLFAVPVYLVNCPKTNHLLSGGVRPVATPYLSADRVRFIDWRDPVDIGLIEWDRGPLGTRRHRRLRAAGVFTFHDFPKEVGGPRKERGSRPSLLPRFSPQMSR